MFKNYFITAWRSLKRNKSYTAINITGLAVGVAACLLIFLIIRFETSFDNFHTKKDQIYRVNTAMHNVNGLQLIAGAPIPAADALRSEFPQLKGVAAIFQADGSYFTVNENSQNAAKKFKEDDSFYAEPQFFDIFDFAWLAGDKKTALTEPNTVALTQDEADKFFGSWKDAIGKVIKLDNKTDLKVTGILKNPPANTDFTLKVVMSYATIKAKTSNYYSSLTDWVTVFTGHYCFLVLPEGQNISKFNNQLAAFAKRHESAEYANQSMQLQSLSDIHYNTEVDIFHTNAFSRQLLSAISLIGLFLLIIACINFINLATAQAVNRSKEVGIRKVLGGNRKQLITQFISETFIITLFAVVLAVIIAAFALPLLNKLLDIHLNVLFLADPVVVLFITCLLVGVTFLAGFYPAIVLSGFNPVSALKNKIAAGKNSGISLRRALVVFQFCIAQILIIGTLVVISQMDYFKNKSLGFAKDAVINVPVAHDSTSLTRINALRNQLLQQPGVKDVSFSFASPSDNSAWHTDFKYNNSTKKTDFEAAVIWADPEYFKLYKLQFVAGAPYNQGDSLRGYVVNEALLKKLGVSNPKDAIGKYINLWDAKSKYAPIIGVVKDYNVASLRSAIPPVLMAPWKNVYRTINIKLQPADVAQTLASVERLWNETFPGNLYEYQFLDDKIAGFYKSENQLSQLYKVFAGIAIFISCLGLYGLISFMAIQRTKEVAIRKTLGSSVSGIVYLFSKEFTVLIIIAFAISAPFGWYFMNKWLQDFTYRITPGPGIFMLAMAASVLISWITVGYKAVTAALVNPVKSLKSE